MINTQLFTHNMKMFYKRDISSASWTVCVSVSGLKYANNAQFAINMAGRKLFKVYFIFSGVRRMSRRGTLNNVFVV